ncbi:hypothetical protein TNCV_5077661 [Trichonephila clavipes]|uniref:Uncharacterized protein n=1 Tax=Trichonephila clavipes TaxID=2585209 RepID=A0A8X6VBD3_TRICX|nr:hypothetical protein TNCV_5077661 [Trichonephila clavipes]
MASRRLDFYLLVHGRYFISLLPPIGNQWRRSPIRHLGTRRLGVTGSPRELSQVVSLFAAQVIVTACGSEQTFYTVNIITASFDTAPPWKHALTMGRSNDKIGYKSAAGGRHCKSGIMPSFQTSLGSCKIMMDRFVSKLLSYGPKLGVMVWETTEYTTRNPVSVIGVLNSQRVIFLRPLGR